MLTTLLILFAFWTQPNIDIPNFHPTYTAAREASKKQQKETVVFFTTRTCSNCNAAWESFERDEIATNKFISTRIDAEDFDGTALFELYQLDKVPCWVVLRVDGRVKEKWSGGWKDTSGKPIVISKSEQPTTTNTSTSDKNIVVPKSTSTIEPKSTEIDESEIVSASTTTPSTSSALTVVEGFVLQAGYFGSEINAKKLISDLEGKGIHYFTVQTTQQNGSTFYRVVSKSFTSEADANKENQVLAAKGIKTTVRSEE